MSQIKINEIQQNEIYKINLKDDQIFNEENELEQQQNWPNILFHGKKQQYANIQMIGPQSCGKTNLAMKIIETQGNKDKTNIIWITAIIQKDVLKFLEKYKKYTILGPKDIEGQKLEQIMQQLKDEKEIIENGVLNTLSTKYKIRNKKQPTLYKYQNEDQKYQIKPQKLTGTQYIRNFIIFDDILLNQNQQKQLLLMLKIHRHIYLSIISLSQDIVSQNLKSLRNCYNVQIFFTQISNDRFKQIIFKEQKGAINYDKFIAMYEDCIAEPYNFFLIDNRGLYQIYQCGFKQYYLL